MLDEKPKSAGHLVSDDTSGASTSPVGPREDFLYMGTYYRGAALDGDIQAGMVNILDLDNRHALVPVNDLPVHLQQEALAIEAKAAQAAAAEATPTPDPTGALNLEARVAQVVSDGLLITYGDQNILLRGYPGADQMADGDVVHCHALPDGIFKYETALGTVATIHAYRVAQ